MRIYVDDRECPLGTTPAPRTVGDALAFAAGAAEREGRRIVEVVVDGEMWTDAELGHAERLERSAEVVHCTSVCPSELLHDTFLSAIDALVEIERLQCEAARLLQADDTKRGMETLLQALTMWTDIHGAASQGIAFGRIDSREVTSAEGSFEEVAHALQLRLSALRDAIQRHDTVAVSDCLLYEFPQTIKSWSAVLSELAKRAKAMAVA